jgi:hypothetical protein
LALPSLATKFAFARDLLDLPGALRENHWHVAPTLPRAIESAPEQSLKGAIMAANFSHRILRLTQTAVLAAFVSWFAHAHAQDAAPLAGNPNVGGQPPVNAAVNGIGGFGVGGFVGGNNGGQNAVGVDPGAQGGAASADFDSLIDLITSTVDSESWQENGTGEGEIQPFPTGVWVDATGNLRFGGEDSRRLTASLASVREGGAKARPPANGAKPHAAGDPRAASDMRYVSLPRLEAAIAQRQAAHLPLDPAMLTLGGMRQVKYVLVYPETGDLVLAGPAGDWRPTREGMVDVDTGRPLVRLDDLLTLWRRQLDKKSSAFGCSIVPRQEALARTQEYLASTAGEAIEASDRREWLKGLRDTVGVQDVEYYNIDPNTRVAGLLLAADYHMKLVGMGLAEGVPGVKSYLATVRLGPGGQAPPMSILRWWFSMPTSTVTKSPEGDAFSLPANCVQVLSENEMLAARGERVHTGQSDALNSAFAKSFTKEFATLSDKYPIYGQLARVFELSLALAVIEKQGLAAEVGWSPNLLLDGEHLRLPRVGTPQGVETVINHRVIGGRQIIAGVSGGVWVDGGKSVAMAAAQGDTAAALAAVRKAPSVGTQAGNDAEPTAGEVVWWWD